MDQSLIGQNASSLASSIDRLPNVITENTRYCFEKPYLVQENQIIKALIPEMAISIRNNIFGFPKTQVAQPATNSCPEI